MSNEKEQVSIRLLTLSDCDYCMWLKSELDGEGISYTNIDADDFPDLADAAEEKFKTDKYPIVFIEYPHKVITIVPETSLELSTLLRTFNTIPELIGIIKSYI